MTGAFIENTTNRLNKIAATLASSSSTGCIPKSTNDSIHPTQTPIVAIAPLIAANVLHPQSPTTAEHAPTPSATSNCAGSKSLDSGTASQRPPAKRSITFRNGEVLEFTEDDLEAPPAVSFAGDLGLLNSMWDDKAPHWCGRSYLDIKGVPIPIKYWKEAYSHSTTAGSWKQGQWKGIKGSWSQWKVSRCRVFHFLILMFSSIKLDHCQALAKVVRGQLLA